MQAKYHTLNAPSLMNAIAGESPKVRTAKAHINSALLANSLAAVGVTKYTRLCSSLGSYKNGGHYDTLVGNELSRCFQAQKKHAPRSTLSKQA